MSSARKLPKRPVVFQYHDYRAYLVDWVEYRKSSDPDFSMKALAAGSGLSVPFLYQVLSGRRKLTVTTLTQLLPALKAASNEQSYLESLVKLAGAASSDARIRALDEMRKYSAYQKLNPKEAECAEYMSHWHNVAIRELAALPEFKPDPKWIQEQFFVKLPLSVIKDALTFLTEKGYLVKARNGRLTPSKELVNCDPKIFWAALVEYHRQAFQLAIASMEKQPQDGKVLEGFTVAMGKEKFKKAKAILLKALDEICALEDLPEDPSEGVFQVETALFALSKRGPT